MKKNSEKKIREIALVGNPNTGKTTIFNALTGLRHHTANYPGVTVEKRDGLMRLAGGEDVSVIDLPGTYSLLPRSPDEQVVHDVLFGVQKGIPLPDLVVVVIAANNLERNLYFATQAAELGIRTVFAVNMWDVAAETGIAIDLEKLEALTGARCVPAVGMKKEYTRKLKKTIQEELGKKSARPRTFDPAVDPAIRYQAIENIVKASVKRITDRAQSISETIDRILTHRVWGLVAFVAVMGFVFQSIFTWAQIPADFISSGVDWMGTFFAEVLPDGALESLVVDGVIAGVGNVVVFLPQIMFLFFFIALFEDTGYMARAVFVLDRLMKKVGLNGKAFLPLLSGFACAVPGIMATRTIEDRNDRLATMLVTPFMTCSARLPVYTLMIAAFIPSMSIFYIFNLKGIVFLAMYVMALGVGLGIAALFRKTFLKGNKMPFVFELPPYRIPHMRTVLVTMWDRAKEFLVRAGSIIFLLSIVLWFAVSYPKDPAVESKFSAMNTEATQTLVGEPLEERLSAIALEENNQKILHSYAGRLGKFIEPAIQPLGFNWEIGIGLVASFAAREVIVSTLAIIHNVGAEEGVTTDLIQILQKEKDPETGLPKYTPLIAVSLMVFFALAMQCLSTVAVVQKETRTWYWPIFMIAYMTTLAWLASFFVFQGGRLLGFQ